jgi:radical SAM superfamily enzyme YgiQ (UPF0313 family)
MVFSFDLEGRPFTWYLDGTIFKRSLGSRVHTRKKVGNRRVRAVLSSDDAVDSFRVLLDRIISLPVRVRNAEDEARLQRILAWSPERLLTEKDRFEHVYQPVSILPPDQYLSVVLQATFGCTWNRCNFCGFYQDRRFSRRSVDEFRKHCLDVHDLLGEGLKLRRGIFLADGNALVLSGERLFPIMETAVTQFPGMPVHGFVDVLNGERRPLSEWSELRDLGLLRVHVGLETGCNELLSLLNKPGSAEESLRFVSTLKEAGLKVGLIFMVGAGGRRFVVDHMEATLALVEKLPLQERDIVYLSPFLPEPESVYRTVAEAAGTVDLTEPEIEEELKVLKYRIRRLAPAATVTRYDIREFLY